MIYLHVGNYEEPEQHYIVSNIEFEAAVPSINKNFFHQIMVHFLNKLKLNDYKYQTNGAFKEKIYKGGFLFTMKYFVSFGTYCQSIFFI